MFIQPLEVDLGTWVQESALWVGAVWEDGSREEEGFGVRSIASSLVGKGCHKHGKGSRHVTITNPPSDQFEQYNQRTFVVDRRRSSMVGASLRAFW